MNNLEEFEIAYNKYTGRDTSAPVERLKHPVPGITYKYQYANDMLAFWNAARAGLIAQLEAAQKERDEATQRLIRYSMSAGEADQRRCESRAVRDELGFEKDADDVAPIDLRNAIVAIRDRAEKAEAALSAANDKLSKPVELSSNWIDPASVWNDDEPTMPVDEVIKAIKAAGFTVEGE